MRHTSVLLAFVALALLPVASAMGETTVAAPDVHVWLDGQKVVLDSTSVLDGGKGADVAFETKDVDVRVGGPTCTVDPSVEGAKGVPSACRTERVDAPRPSVTDLVEARIGLDLVDDAPSGPAAADAAAQAESAQPFTASAPTALLAAAAAGVSLAAVYGVWRVLKWTGLAAFIPLYSHLSDNELLDDANRGAIYRLIQAEPGISTKDVATRLDLAWGTVTHHLGKLEKRRFVVSKKYGKYRRYFANGHGGTEHKDQVAVLRLDRTGDVAALIKQQPGLTQKAVSAALGVSSSTILWHVKRLEAAQLVTKVREGKLVRYYPGAGLDSVLVTPAAPAVPVTAA